MFKRLVPSICVFALLVLGLSFSTFAQEAHEAAFVSQGAVEISATRFGEVFIRDSRRFNLEAGLNVLSFSNVPDNFDPNSVTMSFSGEGFYLSQQRFFPADASNRYDLLLASIDQTITLVRADGTQLTGILRGINSDELLLELENGQIMSAIAGDYRQIIYPENVALTASPSHLDLWVNSPEAGEVDVSLNYRATGLTWEIQYSMLLQADQSINLNAWLSLNNYMGVHLENARITLIAGASNQVQFVAAQHDTMMAAATATAMPTEYAARATMPTSGGGGGYGSGGYIEDSVYQEYPLPENVTMRSGETLRLEFLAGANLSSETRFVYDASPRIFGYSGFITAPTYGLSDIRSVQNFLEVSADRDLPSGEMSIFQVTETGAQRLIGQSLINYTPANTPLRVYLANSEEVTGERIQIDFQQLSDDAIQETFEIRLRNNSDEPVLISVPERMSRSAIWEILASTVAYEQPDIFGIFYEVEVPANESLTISYTVLYTR